MFKKSIKMKVCLITLVSFLLLLSTAFGQGTQGTLSGTVTDASGGVMVGATITARNIDTGVESKVNTNNAGVYNLVVQPGNYEVFAEAPGFQRTTRTGIRLAAGASISLSLPMAVMGQVTEISVSGSVESLTLETTASTGVIFQEDLIMAMPSLSGNAINTINFMGGVTRLTSGSEVFNVADQSIAGVAATNINVVRDGISVNEVRNNTGISGASNINPEVVGEMKILLSSVDAELGRGAGQILVQTRSGTNAWHGAVVWNVQNSVLDAVDFSVKRRATVPSWRNMNNYTASLSGPIIKNKTFFFVNWEQQFARERERYNAKSMTSCARRGIYRYLTSDDSYVKGGWIPAAMNSNNAYNLGPNLTGSMRSVNEDGTPWKGGTVFDSSQSPYVERTVGATSMRVESIFGELQDNVRAALLRDDGPSGKTAWGNAVDGCTIMDTMGYNPMNGIFLTKTDGTRTANGVGFTNGWVNPTTGISAYRYAYDPTGFADRFALTGVNYEGGGTNTVIMPPPNYFYSGDGLNYAAHTWTRTVIGSGSSIYGTGGDPDRKTITLKIDHNINNDHRLSVTYNHEHFAIDDGYAQWPEQYGGYGGSIDRIPYGFTVTLNSTIRPTLLSEFRFGISQSETWTYAPWEAKNGDKMVSVLRALMPTDSSSPWFSGSWAQDQVLLIGLGEGGTMYHTDSGLSHPYGSRGNIPATWGGADPRWSFSENLTWVKGGHSFKGGVSFTYQSSQQDYYGARSFSGGSLTGHPVIRGGATTGTTQRRASSLKYAASTTAGRTWQNVYNGSQDEPSTFTVNGNYTLPYQMMSYFSGSLGNMTQYFYAVPDTTSPTGSRWNDIERGEDMYSYKIMSGDYSLFFKDDWKVTRDLTLNLGVRWEYYGVPYASNGRTIGVLDGSDTVWGITQGGSFNNKGKGWVVDRNFLPGFQRDASGRPILPDPVLRYGYIGPESPRPDLKPWDADTNNLAPAVGFAWQLPWFGKGLTTLRGGYSISYSQLDTFNNFAVQFVDVAAVTPSYEQSYSGIGDRTNPNDTAYYWDTTDLKRLLPIVAEGARPMGIKANDALFSSGASVNDRSLSSPYTHSLNMSITRSIRNNMTLDVRYIGTLGRNQIVSLNTNAANWSDTSFGWNWIEELEKVRLGQESALLNSLVPQNPPPGGGTNYYSTVANATGSAQVRTQQQANLATASFSGIVSGLGTTNGQIPLPTTTTRGQLARAGCLPADRPGYLTAFASNPMTNVNNFPCSVGTPLNLFVSNPQYGSATLRTNSSDQVSNYHSMQVQYTLRPTRGLNFQATYTWSRNLGNGSWTNYLGERDYSLSGQHRSHTIRTLGTYELPFGPRGLLFRDTSSAIRKAIEGWQVSWTTAMDSGAPLSVTGSSVLWGRSWPILVRPDLWNDKQGKIRWNNENFMSGTYLERDYVKVLDRNICNPAKMDPSGTGYNGWMYSQQCEYIVSTSGGVNTIAMRSGAPRAVALGTRDAKNEVVAATYDRDYTAADGITYKAGDPIIVFRNATQEDGINAGGNYKPGRMTAQGTFSFDVALTKRIEFMEGKSFELRVDSQNILNHPTATSSSSPTISSGGRYVSIDAPSMSVSGTTAMGQLASKGGHRTFQARIALRF